MYLGIDDSHTAYDRSGQQRHTQGAFLLLLSPEEGTGFDLDEMRACVRQVALEQMGHYMMGKARIGGESFTVSGAYGNNGLTLDVPREIWEEYGTPVPEHLREAWKDGGGHNSAGSEGEALREWAIRELTDADPSDRLQTPAPAPFA